MYMDHVTLKVYITIHFIIITYILVSEVTTFRQCTDIKVNLIVTRYQIIEEIESIIVSHLSGYTLPSQSVSIAVTPGMPGSPGSCKPLPSKSFQTVSPRPPTTMTFSGSWSSSS